MEPVVWQWILKQIQGWGIPHLAKRALQILQAKNNPTTLQDTNLLLQKYYHKHTFCEPYSVAAAVNSSKHKEHWPVFHRSKEGVGIIQFYGWNGYSKQWNRKVIVQIRSCLKEWYRTGIKGVVLDFRRHVGGNMWPYLYGLASLLEDSTLLAFGVERVSRTKSRSWINMSQGKIVYNRPYCRKSVPVPVAVLVGPKTASSGELTALVFKGRKGVRVFGSSPTAGFTSVNDSIPYKKQLWLHLTTLYPTGYNGRFHGAHADQVIPDIQTPDPLKTALKWVCTDKIQLSTKGVLVGYHLKDPDRVRRAALLALFRSTKLTYGQAIKRLNVLAIYNKNKNPERSAMIRKDMVFIRKRYGNQKVPL